MISVPELFWVRPEGRCVPVARIGFKVRFPFGYRLLFGFQ